MNGKKKVVSFVVVAFLLCGVFGGLVVEQSLAVGYSDSVSFDFGTASSPLASGWIRVTHESGWDDALGYGWSNLTSLSSADRATSTDVRRDFVYSTEQSTNYTFSVSLDDNGLYMLTCYFGDMSYLTYNCSYFAEGSLLELFGTIVDGGIVRTYNVNVTDRKLDFICFSNATSGWRLAGLDVKLLEASGGVVDVAQSEWLGVGISFGLIGLCLVLALKSKSWAVNFLFGLSLVGFLGWQFANASVELFGGWLDFMVLVGAVLVLVKGAVLVRSSGL